MENLSRRANQVEAFSPSRNNNLARGKFQTNTVKGLNNHEDFRKSHIKGGKDSMGLDLMVDRRILVLASLVQFLFP
jgi:hypothetical protein